MGKTSYEQTSYFRETGYSWRSVRNNAGRAGEYSVFQNLRSFENNGCKFLFNVYIPKKDGSTSECDVLLLTPSGIVSIESKNYSGWIFGNQRNRMWTETHKTRKDRFYNPVWQNATHIKNLKAVLGYPKFPIWNVIAFSDKCTFKDVTTEGSDAYVVHYRDLFSLVKSLVNDSHEQLDVETAYDQLKAFTQVDEETRRKHDETVKEAQGKRPSATDHTPLRDVDHSQRIPSAGLSDYQKPKNSPWKGLIIALAALVVLALLIGLLNQESATKPEDSLSTTSSPEMTLAENQASFFVDGGQTIATVDSVDFTYSDNGKKIVIVTGTYENVSVASGLDFDFNNGLEHLAVTNQNGIPLMHETWFKDVNTKLLPGGKLTITDSFQVGDDDSEVIVHFVYPNNHGIRQGEFRYPVT